MATGDLARAALALRPKRSASWQKNSSGGRWSIGGTAFGVVWSTAPSNLQSVPTGTAGQDVECDRPGGRPPTASSGGVGHGSSGVAEFAVANIASARVNSSAGGS